MIRILYVDDEASLLELGNSFLRCPMISRSRPLYLHRMP